MKIKKKIYRFKEISSPEEFVPALTKGVKDVETVIDRLQFLSINDIPVSFLDVMHTKNKFLKLKYYFNFKRVMLLVKLLILKDKEIFLNYPFIKGRLFDYVIENVVINRNNVSLLVHDVYSLQMSNINFEQLKKEIKIFNRAKRIIFHNNKMVDLLKKYGLSHENYMTIDIFDYIINDKIFQSRNFSKEIIFAGNIAKANFLKEFRFLKKFGFILNLYGPNYKKEELDFKNISYKGILDPEEIVHKMDGSFGLIWDGDSIKTCTGNYGEYLKYNNPFKFSMYIAAGIPVICWKNSAIANFIEINKIGFCIDKIEDINNLLNELNEEKYQNIRANVIKLGMKLRTGYNTENAIKEIYNL